MNQKPFRTLILWTVWLSTAMIVYLSLYRDTDVWSFIRHDPSKITWLILIMFAMGVLGSFVLVVLLTFEHLEAQRADEILRRKGLGGMVLPRRRRRAVHRFFEALRSVVDSNGQPDVDLLLHTELAVYHRISHSIEVLGNLLITLGLIGTVLGLTLTLTGLTGSLEALGQNQEALLAGLRKAMAGMGTAFYTTLLGAVLGGVLLRVFAQITEHGVDALHDNLTRTVMVRCGAELQPSLERDVRALDGAMAALGEHVKVLEIALNHSRGAMSQFREEVSQLKEATRGEMAALAEEILRHRQYVELLQKEARLLRRLNRPWWALLRRRTRRRLEEGAEQAPEEAPGAGAGAGGQGPEQGAKEAEAGPGDRLGAPERPSAVARRGR
ncbi:MAG: hypothetical protein D6809_06820 [Gammaproteobacteria bacterium]|nr:MAG: hypothetical protein D6809_06820 [Gammaproteobacteria bacterium]